jgi:hypothetical protein
VFIFWKRLVNAAAMSAACRTSSAFRASLAMAAARAPAACHASSVMAAARASSACRASLASCARLGASWSSFFFLLFLY